MIKIKNTGLKFLVFVSVGAIFSVLLLLLNQDHPSWAGWKEIQSCLTPALKTMITAAFASAAAVLIPWFKAPEAPERPEPPVIVKTDPQPLPTPLPEANISQIEKTEEPTVPLAQYEQLSASLDRWINYESEVKNYVQKVNDYSTDAENLRSMLDTRQAVLRVAAYASLLLAFGLCVAGFIAPIITQRPGDTDPIDASQFFEHMSCLTMAVAIVGSLIGVVIHQIRAVTNGWHAVRGALICSLILCVSTQLVSLPYVYVVMGRQRVHQQIFSVNTDFLMMTWMAFFRLGVFPAVCSLFSYLSFQLAQVTLPRRLAPFGSS